MDIATILGLVLAITVIIVALIMDGGSPAELFAHPSALILIFGGSAGAGGRVRRRRRHVGVRARGSRAGDHPHHGPQEAHRKHRRPRRPRQGGDAGANG